MADKKNDITNKDTYLRYLNGQMTPAEQHAFEKRLLEDEFEMDALEGFTHLAPPDLQSDFELLTEKIKKRPEKSKVIVFWRVAAAFVLLAIFSFVAYLLIDQDNPTEVVKKYETPEIAETESTDKSSFMSDDSVKSGVIPEDSDGLFSDSEVTLQVADTPQETSADISLNVGKYEDEAEVEQFARQVEEIPDPVPSATLSKKVAPVESASAPAKIELPTQEHIAEIPESPQISRQMATAKKRSAPSETRMITGRITSEEDPGGIPGVNIVLKGTSIGTVSDMQGEYALEVPEGVNPVIVYSSVGYVSEEVVLNDRQQMNINMEPDANTLSEIVVIGYGAQAKKDLLGAVSVADENKQSGSYIPPAPVGGNNAFKSYIEENLRYPASGLEQGIKGTVRLKFTIKPDGRIADMQILKSLGKDFDREAIRLISEGPAWEPARENDVLIEKEVKINIRFRPSEK